uniref:Cadherin domain-containing protein n=1 Tax=Oreochromis niloticus TaxID=8128 RepID=A0A669BQ26_ORENI
MQCDWLIPLQSYYNLTVAANDCAQPASLQFTSTAHVIVITEDVNDNAPIVTFRVLHSAVFLFLFVLFSYSMENLNVPFAIDETSGELFTTNILDRETVAIYNLEVTASDKHPIQPLSSSVNDNAPRFSQIFLTEVSEDTPVGETGTPPLISQAEITFQITGRNQFTPSFSESYVT